MGVRVINDAVLGAVSTHSNFESNSRYSTEGQTAPNIGEFALADPALNKVVKQVSGLPTSDTEIVGVRTATSGVLATDLVDVQTKGIEIPVLTNGDTFVIGGPVFVDAAGLASSTGSDLLLSRAEVVALASQYTVRDPITGLAINNTIMITLQ